MPEPVVAPASARPGRCANHPSVAMVGTCERCGRSVCSACAIPVRGTLIGPECLGAILDEAPSVTPPSLAVPATGDRVAVAGFALVVLISMFPWSRFGDSSRYLGAWTLHWSLAASLAGVAGLVFALFAWRRPPPPLLVVAVEGTLGFIVAATALLHYHHPPPLSVGSTAPMLALIGGAMAVLGASLKAIAVVRAARVGAGAWR